MVKSSLLRSALAAWICAAPVQAFAAPATLILHNADIWTVDEAKPTARAVAIEGNRIVKVGTDAEVMRLKGVGTRVVDLKGAFVLPGFIDAHTHFGNATESFFEVRLVDVNAMPPLVERLAAAARDIPKGMWITGFDWASADAAAAKKRGDKDFKPFTPSLAEVDRVTPDHPVLLRRYDGAYFINSKGLAFIRVSKDTPDPANGAYVKDPATGALTGLLLGAAGDRAAATLPPDSRARQLVGARAMLHLLTGYGFTGIHDITHVEEISQTKTYHTAVERSFTPLGLFQDLRTRGELSLRVHPILTAANWRDYAARGITPGGGDDLIRYGTLKTFLDSTLMEQPWTNRPTYAGDLSFRVVDLKTLQDDIVGADALGFDAATHVTGDKGHRLVLDMYEAAIRLNPARDRRFRVIHGWYPSRAEVARAGKMGAIIDVQPHHLINVLDGMDGQLGKERAAYAFPWRSMIAAGARINISSDWPGSFDRNSVEPADPMENIYHAVTRMRLDGTPAGGFHPEEALTVDEAIRGYTINPAYASHEENVKGSITEGKLADLVVLSRNIRKINPRDIPAVKVRHTIFNGSIIYTGDDNAK